jgi:hypothetical protein
MVSACCHRPNASQYAANRLTSSTVNSPKACNSGATRCHSSLAAGSRKLGGSGGSGGIVGSGSAHKGRRPGLPRSSLRRNGTGGFDIRTLPDSSRITGNVFDFRLRCERCVEDFFGGCRPTALANVRRPQTRRGEGSFRKNDSPPPAKGLRGT